MIGGETMIKIIKKLSFLFYFLICFFYMEILLRVSTIGDVLSLGLIYSLIFMITVSILFYLISIVFNGKFRTLTSILLLILSAFIYSSQIIYFKVFKTFYTIYSASNASQVLEFSKDIWSVIQNNFLWILLMFIPVILLLIFRKKIIVPHKMKLSYKVILICAIILSHIIGLSTLFLSNKEQFTAYDLYFNSSNKNLSVKELGLITTMRLDLQRHLTGWSPKLESSDMNIDGYSRYKVEESIYKKENDENDEVKNIKYNIMDINFDDLIDNEKNKEIKDIHEYLNKIPATSQNEYTGKFEGYNLIFITAESFSPYAIHEELTPTLYKMLHDGYNFTNFYNPMWDVSTTDGEYVASTGLLPKSGVWSFTESANNSLPFVMGNQLERLDYQTVAYHNHSYKYYNRHLTHPNMGYEYKGIGNGLNVEKTWPESDLEMMEKTIDEYIDNEPFHAYYMTVSGHMQYNFFGNYIAAKNKKYVDSLPYSTEAKAYIATQIELDKSLEYLLDKLEDKGVADNTLIVLSADHYPYALENETIDELTGHDVEENFELYKSPLIIYTEDMEPETIDKPSSSLDIIPTISNLLGLEYDSRLLMGTDIFSENEPLVMFLNRSFITDKGKYNSVTKEFIANDNEKIDEEYIDMISSLVNSKFHYSAKILETDYYSNILVEDKNDEE